MNRNYFLRKKLLTNLKRSFLALSKTSLKFLKAIFRKKSILLVSNNRIKTINLGPISQIAILMCLFFVGNLIRQTLQYDQIIASKSQEIQRLKEVNKYFEDEFGTINEKLKKVSEYLNAVNGGKQDASATEEEFNVPKNIEQENLSRAEKKTIDEIKDSTFALNSIQENARVRIKNIEKAILSTGLSLKKMPNPQQMVAAKKAELIAEKEISLNKASDLRKGQGGPLLSEDLEKADLTQNHEEDALERELEKVQFATEFDRLFLLEKLVSVMPLEKPMKNYYISSGFGTRADPLTHRTARHQGLDFVGPDRAKIISPASGRVVLAGRFSDYGNAVVIDHGFGITTRYGHLSAIKVTQGQVVKKGQVIANQGSTGRSTGQHLHYEVRYRNTPLNPRKFLEAGDFLSNEKTTKYVNS
ncbi:MAG: hypothetical protein FJ368_03415 [Pelagibacterales bacterium]|nr:hypothetical protein [Pelagibacterales bacterium]